MSAPTGEPPFIAREVGDACPDCELLGFAGALCLFHARAAELVVELRDALARLLEAWETIRGIHQVEYSYAAAVVAGFEPVVIRARLAVERARDISEGEHRV